jgi:hypothetical protein
MSSTDSYDPDGWPDYYVTGPEKHMHALGVVALNFNMLEATFFTLFRHPLMQNGVDLDTTWAIFSRLQDNQKRELMKDIYEKSEPDSAVKSHVKHALSYFDACTHNRNTLLHSIHGGLSDLTLIDLRKNIRGDWSKMQFWNLGLSTLRRIADEMHSGTDYVTDIWFYLQSRDGLASAELLSILKETHPSLPEKPDVPQILDLKTTPRNSTEPPLPPVPFRG